METVINENGSVKCFLCSKCVAYRVEAKGQACGRCSREYSAETDADMGAAVTLLLYAAIGVGVIVFLAATFLMN